MTFLAPTWLLLLLAVAALVAVYVLLQRRRRHYAARFTNLELLASIAPKRPGWRRHVSAAAAALGLAALVLALARPARDERVPRDEATVMLVVDVSASMTADDVAPTRLDAAKTAAADFVEGLPDGFQVGLIAFDGDAQVLATPTTDHTAVNAALARIEPGPGTATGDAVNLALDTIAAAQQQSTLTSTTTDAAEPNEATIVLLSDGATTAGEPLDTAAQAAADAGVPVTTIAYGTADGTVTLDGEIVAVPADEAAMELVAETTDGSFFTAASADELDEVYDDIQSRIGFTIEQREIGRTFVGVAVVALIAAVATSMLWAARFL